MTVVPQSTGRPVILLADTDREYLRLLGSLLQESCTVRATHSAERALHAMTTHPLPDLVLLGINDPALHALPQETILPIPKPVHAFSLWTELRRRLPGRLPAPAGKLSQRRALVVEDDALLQQIVVEVLLDAGIGVQVASNGLEAMAILERECFDWILMDVQMPVMDGLAATREIRANPQQAERCIIALSCSDRETDRQDCLAAGMNDYLTKPVDPASLLAKLAEWIDQHSPSLAPDKVGSGKTDPTLAFDLAILDELAQGKLPRIQKYAHNFNTTVAAGLVKIDQALKNGELGVVRSEAHKLKSAARWVGAHALGTCCAELEKSTEHNLATAQQLAIDCSVHYTAFSLALNEHLAAFSSLEPNDPSS